MKPPRSGPPAPPRYTPKSSRSWWTRRRKRAAKTAAKVVGAFLLLFYGVDACADMRPPTTGELGAAPGGAAPCPWSVGRWLPAGGGGATLVGAYQTGKHLVTLCRTASGQVYYDGQVKGKPADTVNHISLPAESTGGGWEARNGNFTYRVADGRITVRERGSVVLDEPLQSA
ncbi:hypothetical protein ABTZ99_01120 [Actinosynnema sp. NPDC002837]